MLEGVLLKAVLVVGLVEVDLSPFPFGLLYWKEQLIDLTISITAAKEKRVPMGFII
jgi:hypothetical protein